MGTGKKMQAFTPDLARNLNKDQLGGVIFGCTGSTIKECLSKQLFGLPGQHYVYVRNIDPGLPLFLFNYSKRALHGIFEAASPGEMNINPYGWTTDGSDRTSYPAQVRIRVLKNCHPLVEHQFSPIIKGNYYTQNHFQFELDHVQVRKLISLFSAQVIPSPPPPMHRNMGNLKIINPPRLQQKNTESDGIKSDANVGSIPKNKSNGHWNFTDPSPCLDEIHEPSRADVEAVGTEETNLMYEKLQKLAVNCEPSGSYSASQEHDSTNGNEMLIEGNGSREQEMVQKEDPKDSALSQSGVSCIIAQLVLEVQELKVFKQEQTERVFKLESVVQQLRDRNMMLEPLSTGSVSLKHGTLTDSGSDLQLDSGDIIFLAGGYDGASWLASADSFSPSKDIIKSLCPMSSARSYAPLAKLKGHLYVMGGSKERSWCNTVESYDPVNNSWRPLACLNKKKGCLAAATLHDKIFAIGGGDGVESFSDVEMFDLDVGRWISARSMLQKRFALAAAELNGAIYAVGGFDGDAYLSSTERFDPREHSWSRLGSMNVKRGCHSITVLNDKLYAVGGFDGKNMVASVEVFDPRRGTWIIDASMNHNRGYSAVVALSNRIYAIGGSNDRDIVEEVERYEEGRGWQLIDVKATGKRSFASAIVL